MSGVRLVCLLDDGFMLLAYAHLRGLSPLDGLAQIQLLQCFGAQCFGVSSQNRTGWVGFRYPSNPLARDKPEESTGEAPETPLKSFEGAGR